MMGLADHSLRVVALILVVGAGSLMARRASAHSRLFAWTVVLYMAVAMPGLAAVLPDLPLPVVFSDPVIVMPSSDPVIVETALNAEDAIPARRSLSALPWLLALYLMGTGLLVTRLIAGTHLTARVLRRARPADDVSLAAEMRALSSAMKLPRVPRVVEHASVHVPFVCGLFRPVLVLPEGWRSWDATTRQAVLTHELSHIVRRDLWTMRAASLYCAATWINPISWWLRRKLETLTERASDDEVLASGVEPAAYAEVLVHFFAAAQRGPSRASWQLAMARRGGVEAQKQVGRVLNASEGGNVRFGLPGRVLIGVGVVLAAVPAIVLSASRFDAVSIQEPPIVSRSVEPQAERLGTQAEPRSVEPLQRRVKQLKVDLVKTAPMKVLDVALVPQTQEQEQEPEPWRSTRKATDADVAPALTRMLHPKYTPDAMRAKIQGFVAVEVIISPEGEVTAARIKTSLDKDLGLDDEALKVARQWKFLPGTHQGQPVALRAIIELEFRLH